MVSITQGCRLLSGDTDPTCSSTLILTQMWTLRGKRNKQVNWPVVEQTSSRTAEHHFSWYLKEPPQKTFTTCPVDIELKYVCSLFHIRTYGGNLSFVVRVWLIWVIESSFLYPLQTGVLESSCYYKLKVKTNT